MAATEYVACATKGCSGRMRGGIRCPLCGSRFPRGSHSTDRMVRSRPAEHLASLTGPPVAAADENGEAV